MRELLTLFPDAAAVHYDRELESLNPLYDLCAAASQRGAWEAEDRVEAGKLIGEALQADREAIASIEATLALIDGSR